MRHRHGLNLWVGKSSLTKYFLKCTDTAQTERARLTRNGRRELRTLAERFDVAGYLDHQGDKFVSRFDANAYLILSRAMDLFDPARQYGSEPAALRRIRARVLLISISSDWLFPAADVPVVQVALPVEAGPQEVFSLGRALQALRESGVLLIGSGSMTHNLNEFFGGERAPLPYVQEFSRWVEAALQRADVAALLDYRRQAPHAVRAHPSEDHFLPLFFALGAAGEGASAHYLSREVMHGILAMDAFALNTAADVAAGAVVAS